MTGAADTIPLPNMCRRVGKAAQAGGSTIYAVGGAVRNSLLGLPEADWDLCGPQSADAVRASLDGSGIHVTDAVNGLGTAILAAEDERYEYTAFRKDSYPPGGAHTPTAVAFTENIRTDAERRDFTVNALYADLTTGEVLDPLGTGLADLRAGILRMVRRETLCEDALRVLRLVRFSAELGLRPDPETLAAAREYTPNLANISPERKRDEFFRILLSDAAYGRLGAPARGLMMLRDIGALRYIIPQLEEGEGCVQSPKYHRYDVLNHSIAVCALTPPDLTTRLAGLLHDMAKPEAFAQDGNMHRHAQIGEVRAKAALRTLHAPNELAADTAHLVKNHMFDLENTARPGTVRKWILAMGPKQFRRLCDLREADFAGSGMGNLPESAWKWREVLRNMECEKAPMSTHDLAVNGSDLIRELGVEPGPEIGWLLRALLEHAVAHPARNNYKSLLKYARMLKSGALGVPGRKPRRGRSEGDHKGV